MFCQQLSTVVIETIRVCVTDWERGKENAWGEEQRIIICIRLEKGGRGNMYDADKIACENPHELFQRPHESDTESHEIKEKSREVFQFSWEKKASHEKNEILMSEKPHEKFSSDFENSHEKVIFSWESHEILMRKQKLTRIFVRATICKTQEDGMILEMIVLVLHQIFTQLPFLIHLCQTNFNHNLMLETVLHPLMLLHWPNSQMPMPRCIFLTVLCVLTSLDPDFTYLSAMPSEGTAGNVIWTWSTKLVTSAQRAAHVVGKLFCTQLSVIVSGCIAITSCLSHSFFFTFLPLFALVGGGALGMLVSYTEMRTVKTIFLFSNGVFDIFCAFCKVERPIFGFLDKKPSRKCKLVHTKVLLVLC